jgi:hypothetical protein
VLGDEVMSSGQQEQNFHVSLGQILNIKKQSARAKPYKSVWLAFYYANLPPQFDISSSEELQTH